MIYSQKIFTQVILAAAFLIAGASLFSIAKADACDELKNCYSDCKGIHPSSLCHGSCERIAKSQKHMSEDEIQKCLRTK